jgi:hypothetical protein
LTYTGDDLDRTTSGRFVRNLALSLSGGALVTLLGATAAQAQDGGSAGTESGGTGAAQSGDATAVGNQSGTNTTQTVTVSGNLGTIQVINQQASVSNVGVAAANTGGNIAIGNSSNNGAEVDQTGASGLGPASNTGEAANGSNGTATISTGNASAIGNQSNTTINQTAHGSAHGQLGGILVINQDALVTNSGVALANTGGNSATGNESGNEAGLVQDANSSAGIAANSGKAHNSSDGKATINSGNASATGNKSDTQVIQNATGSAGGSLGGLVIIDQDAFVVNAGAAVANSGANEAIGNTSESSVGVEQALGDPGAPPVGPIGVASNNGEASNWSGGTANIDTGDATAFGNDSTTRIEQNANADIEGFGGGSLVSQSSGVVNAGFAVANSGDNRAVGNDSGNTAGTGQAVDSSGGTDVGVVGNFGLAENISDGTGVVQSGAASATGSRSKTDVVQNVVAEGGAFNLETQANLVTNLGAGFANSGDNEGIGNQSGNGAEVGQEATLSADPGLDVGVVGQFGKASNTSDGTASITTGDATAVGNDSETVLTQTIDPSGIVVNTQAAAVVNAGVGIANSGGDTAVGNVSGNGAGGTQTTEIATDNGGATTLIAGTVVGSNNGEASNTSDGSATISTGDATATGNQSSTRLDQEANGAIDGNGAIFNTQLGLVTNTGIGLANSGGNTAIGNESENGSDFEQDVDIASDNAGTVDVIAGIITASNDGTASNASDGSANIVTGNATATGNRSQTALTQDANGDIDGLGLNFNTQVGVVANAGLGVANSGGNRAVGNTSENEAALDQDVEIASDNDDDVTLTDIGFVTGANSGTAENASDGTADIRTGNAQGTGNASSTTFTQDAAGHVNGLGLAVNTQVGGVVNAGVGLANSGGNLAVGNVSDNAGNDGASLEQDAEILSNNEGTADGFIVGPVTAHNSGTASNTSDGTARIRTGDAQGQGNVSSTFFDQRQDSTIDGFGAVFGTQVGGVANVGVGVANSGLNLAVGNGSTNDSDLDQDALIAARNDDDTELTVFGPTTASNSAEASNTSDGTAHIGTGGALATGNASATNLSQHQDNDVDGLGLVLGTQVGGVANVGVGVANSGLNAAIANISDNDIDDVGDPTDPAEQDAEIGSDTGDPFDGIFVGPVTAANDGTATNVSDGDACVCTGDAVASGNVSSTTLIQDANLTVGSGLIVLTEAGGVLNAGVGLANTGLNMAVGNASENDVEFDQDSTINDAILGLPIVGPQTAHNGGNAANTSGGSGHIGSGNASGTGNQSTTDFVQAATVDSDFALSTIVGGTTNAGVGLANSGLNLGVGNNSTNRAILDQDADGAGIVDNNGAATNDSDGFAQIGDPTCCDDEVTPPAPEPQPEETPRPGGLPRTGAELETQAAVALMLLLLGFGLRRRSQRLA